MENLLSLAAQSGFAQLQLGQVIMILIALTLLFLAIKHGFEPLLLVPIGFGTLLVNIPGAEFDSAPIYDALGRLEEPGGLLFYIYDVGIATGIFPLSTCSAIGKI